MCADNKIVEGIVVMKIFIDESGNTGSDIMIKNQPVFVLAGVMLDSRQEQFVLQRMQEIFEQIKEKEELEIKAAKWCRSPKKAYALETILNEILVQNGTIAVVIFEKRFMAGAMVIDNFFDYVYNDIVDRKWVNCREAKIQGADYFYERMNDELATKVWDLFREPKSPEKFECIIDELLLVTDNKEYRALLQGAKSHIPELVADLFPSASIMSPLEGLSPKTMRAPNFSAFNRLVDMFIPVCHLSGQKAEIIVDEQRQFENAYKKLFDIFSNIKYPYIPLGPNIDDCIFSWKDAISKVSIGNSINDKGVQLADIVASSINSLMLKAHFGDIDSFLELDLFNIALLQTLDKTCHTVHYVASKSFFKRYYDTVRSLSFRINEICSKKGRTLFE